MAKKKPQAVPVVIATPKRYTIADTTYTEGETLQIITPELGVLTCPIKFQSYSSQSIVSFDLGWVKTPLPCKINYNADAPNAILSMTRTLFEGSREKHDSCWLHLVYFCGCRYGAHTDVLVWRNSILKGHVVCSEQIGKNPYSDRYNHPLVEGYEHLKPPPIELIQPSAPTIKPGTQFNLF